MNDVKKMACDHWKYTEGVIKSAFPGKKRFSLGLVKYIYESAFIHGCKHGRENK